MLSQDEINALLNQGDTDSNISDTIDDINVNEYLSSIEIDAIGEIGNISFGSASTAFSALLDQKVEITTPKISAVRKKNIPKKFPQPHITVNVNYTAGFFGTNLFVLNVKDAKIISDLMLGGNGENISEGELNDMDVSAIQEAMNQMMGSAATSMSTIFNTVVNISTPSLDINSINNEDYTNNLLDDEIILLVSFNMKIGELIDSNFVQLITVSFAKEMIGYLIGSSNDSDTYEEEMIPKESVVSEKEVGSLDDKVTNDSQMLEETVKSIDRMSNNNSSRSNINPNIDVQSAQFSEFDMNKNIKNNKDTNLGLLLDIPLQISVELGRTNKLIKEILELSSGSIVELDKLAGEPVDIYANRKLIAKGEVVVIDENFGVRITDIISQIERVKKLQ